ncbi:hypothetical protein [Fluviibacter phosphoraccumulans]|jgi:hypothetical protein|uniref:Uncharacterized protein n=1 Tax=Fluviibacter phosphoraccumulans TaxID=1751046 RepID=A0A679IDY7_9RHOO|nr:hypothetical protein [Fluviibacter phosphoraccumulans]BBU70047.1 hypothetical protein ICHIAU1_23300 [Fluviibacter phosphoraccumulans]BBU70761.1 hypothetical protein ICHIJ1_06800 [Fluviibacter phosphoraccumulans]BCA65885.1 hypothetical protein SHINM1_014870 [Fluviibacter phosphoraccumulans]
MTGRYTFAEVKVALDGVDLSKPEAIHGLGRVQSMLEAIEFPNDEIGKKILLVLRSAAQKLCDDLVRIHRGDKE